MSRATSAFDELTSTTPAAERGEPRGVDAVGLGLENGTNQVGGWVEQFGDAASIAGMHDPVLTLFQIPVAHHHRQSAAVGHGEAYRLAPVTRQAMRATEHIPSPHVTVAARDAHPHDLGRHTAEARTAVVCNHAQVVWILFVETPSQARMRVPGSRHR
ncbi:MAG TPA: hypothetical protein VFB85_14765 [Vicinamibacterales bacterium]|nr:hypothetical protein [Vicinamibacterales bacterium]